MVNKVFLIGRLGKDPVIKHFSNDNAVAEFSLATNESYKDKEGNWKDITEWHNIKLPNKYMAERAEKQLKKGSQIFVEGKIRSREYEKDGQKHRIVEIIAEQFRSLDKKETGSYEGGGTSGGGSSSYTGSTQQETPVTNSTVEDDLPF
jgi:single-strand DNA-binding protein